VADPAWVDGYRLVSRLGTGGMADVFYAVAPTGGPVALKLLRAGDGVPRTCQREYRLAWMTTAPHPRSATACRGRGRTW
jgi:RIO-like serine/threonine protein kinase